MGLCVYNDEESGVDESQGSEYIKWGPFKGELVIDPRGTLSKNQPLIIRIITPQFMYPSSFLKYFSPLHYYEKQILQATNKEIEKLKVSKKLTMGELWVFLVLWIHISIQPGYPY